MYAQISANAATGVAPEQAAVWSYPLEQGDREETIFNMVNAMLLRIHQSGHLAQLSQERFQLVKEGIDCYKQIRKDIKTGIVLAVWTCKAGDSWMAYGMEAPAQEGAKTRNILSVCLEKRRGAESMHILPVPAYNTPDWNGADMTVNRFIRWKRHSMCASIRIIQSRWNMSSRSWRVFLKLLFDFFL